MYDWNARNLDTQQPEEPPANLWPAVLDALQLTDATRRDALQCFELFGTPLTRLLEERTQLAERYRDLQTTQCSSARSSCDSEASVVAVAHARTLEAVAEPLYSSMAILEALAANLERYQVRSCSVLVPLNTFRVLFKLGIKCQAWRMDSELR